MLHEHFQGGHLMRGSLLGRAGVGVLAVSLVALGTGSVLAGASGVHGSKAHKTSKGDVATAPCTSTDYSLAASVTTASSTISVTGNGQVDFASDAATANVTLPASFPISILAGSTLQAEVVGGTVYVAVPPAFSKFVGGASWVSVALPTKLSSVVDGAFGLLAEGCANAQGVVKDLESHGGTATSLGSSTIGGVPVTGTQVTLSAAHLAAALHVPAKLIGKIPAKLRGEIGRITVPVDVWANSAGQVAQISADVHPDSSGVTNLSVTVGLTGIDQPVSITAPSGAVPLSSSELKAVAKFLGGL
jgi:hypothetical protein